MASPYEKLLVKRTYLLDQLEKLLELSIATAMITATADPKSTKAYGCSKMERSRSKWRSN